MINKIKNNCYVLILLLGLLQPFVSSEVLSIVTYCVLSWVLVANHGKIKIGSHIAIKILFLMFAIGMIVGIANFQTRAFLRDVYYFLNPIAVLLIGINLVKDDYSFSKMLNTIVTISVIVSALCLIRFLLGVSWFFEQTQDRTGVREICGVASGKIRL